MPRKRKSRALVVSGDLSQDLRSIASGLARDEVDKRQVWDFLGRVVSGEGEHIVGVGRDGSAVLGAPKLDQRLTAAKLLLEYGYGKPSTQKAPDAPVDPEELKAAAVDDVLTQLERFARVTQLARVPEGDASEG